MLRLIYKPFYLSFFVSAVLNLPDSMLGPADWNAGYFGGYFVLWIGTGCFFFVFFPLLLLGRLVSFFLFCKWNDIGRNYVNYAIFSRMIYIYLG